jgi:hypothetical protein
MNSEIKVFISYAREDFETAKRLYDDLQQVGLSPWIDSEDILPGQNWEYAINEAIRSSNYFLVLLSLHSVSKKGYVQKELRKALDILDEIPPDEIFIVPVRLDECEPLHERLRGLNWVDIFPSYKVALETILRAIMPVSRFNKKPSIRITSKKVIPEIVVKSDEKKEKNKDFYYTIFGAILFLLSGYFSLILVGDQSNALLMDFQNNDFLSQPIITFLGTLPLYLAYLLYYCNNLKRYQNCSSGPIYYYSTRIILCPLLILVAITPWIFQRLMNAEFSTHDEWDMILCLILWGFIYFSLQAFYLSLTFKEEVPPGWIILSVSGMSLSMLFADIFRMTRLFSPLDGFLFGSIQGFFIASMQLYFLKKLLRRCWIWLPTTTVGIGLFWWSLGSENIFLSALTSLFLHLLQGLTLQFFQKGRGGKGQTNN